ncbi:MAG: diguanylate cyclase [Candidatus Poribacteria bacterium]|nr:diguanylate cyclase [Candidatus Poribacteria bacterium]
MEDRIRVLFIEDDKIDQMAFQRFVKTENLPYDYTIVASFSEAKRMLELKKFDVVATDYWLGDGTAVDIFNSIIETPVIVITGAGDEEIAVKAMRAGAYDYLIKDTERNYLKVLPVTVERAISQGKTQKQIRMLSHAMMGISDSVYITDMADRIIFVNRAFCQTYGYKEEDILGGQSRRIWQDNSTTAKNAFPKIVEGGEFYHRRRDGNPFPVSLSGSVIEDKNGNAVAVVSVVRDITERKRVEDNLWQMAIHDELTGLFNRRYLMGQLASAIRSAKRYGYPLSLCLCDLDNFKSVNDTYGHSMGDEVLIKFGKLITNELRTTDISGRLGGDEFCIIFPHTPASEAASSVERIRRQLEKLVFSVEGGMPFSITASFGIAELTSAEVDETGLFENADQALYRAKRLGRNRSICSAVQKEV